jgi:hypothetical protein
MHARCSPQCQAPRGRAARPCGGELPDRRRRPRLSLGCEQMVRLRAPPLNGMPCQAPARGGGADGAARGAGAWRCLGCVARPVVQRARVHALGCARPWPSPAQPAGCDFPRHEGRFPGSPEPRARRSANTRPGGASRGFPSAQHNGARRRRAPGVLARWLGVAAARRLLWSPSQTRDRVALRAATAELRGTTGPGAPSAAARQYCGAKASTQARIHQQRVSTIGKPTQEEIQGGEERRGLRCSRWGDGGVVAGLPVAWRRCSVREGVPAK